MKKLVSGVLVALMMVGSILLTGCFDGQATTTGNGDQMTTVQAETEYQDETTSQEEMTTEEEAFEDETTEEETTEE